MWDVFNKFRNFVSSNVRHSAGIENILGAMTLGNGELALRNYVSTIADEDDFGSFRRVVGQLTVGAQMMLQQSQMGGGSSSWGVSTEDRIAYQEAHMLAGVPTNSMAQAQAAYHRLHALLWIQQCIDPIWADTKRSRAPASE